MINVSVFRNIENYIPCTRCVSFRVLMETREMLEDQLNSSRRRADKVLELESEIIKYKQLLNDMALVCETWECKFRLHSN